MTSINSSVGVSDQKIKNEQTAARIREKYPDRIPILLTRAKNCKNLPELTKTRFLIQDDCTFSYFIHQIRSTYLKLESGEALYFFTESGSFLSLSAIMSQVYAKHASKDGFLRLTYCSESAFG